MTSESDRLLVQRIRNKDDSAAWAKAWADLDARYRGRIAAYVRRRLKDHASVDDVVQNTLIGFYNSLPNYDDKRDLQTWLFTIASHKVTDLLRSNGRRQANSGSDSPEGESLDRAPDARQRAASSLARSSEKREAEEESIGRALTAIVADWKQHGDYQSVKVLELLFVKGVGNKETAHLIGISEQQVANLKFQAKKRLHEFLRDANLSPEVFPELSSLA